ncbi:MAG: adenylosuccinate synthase [Candidatus Eisenbacteria bacterium]|nr:adenylosuccinate synthase [Candidatus Eisenbacteria bacterium]
MSSLLIIGTQWGDEGKGKLTNYYAALADMIVRFQGGANAGHTVSVSGNPVVFHLLPSGISVPGVTCVIGAGVVIDPSGLVAEIDKVSELGIEVGENLLIDTGAHLTLRYHKAIEQAQERARGARAIGTTMRGIGPTYADRTAREGVTIGELASFDAFAERVRGIAERKNTLLTKAYGAEPVDTDDMLEELRTLAPRLLPNLADTPPIIRGAVESPGNVIFEGAQGTLLDLSFGTYPYVTSSNTSAGGLAPGTGVPPSAIDEVIGVAKAYITRVGAGPFPTESEGEEAAAIRERGHEHGSTTGRPRRCGWLDTVALRYSIALNGIDRLIITKLDVLDACGEIPVCVAYEIDGERTEDFPRSAEQLARAVPVYDTMPGWLADTSGCRAVDELPGKARDYLRRIEELSGARVAAVSVGAASHAIVHFDRVF